MGRHGSTLQAKTQVTINVPKELVPGTRVREVTLIGTAEGLSICYNEIVARLTEEALPVMAVPNSWPPFFGREHRSGTGAAAVTPNRKTTQARSFSSP